MILLIDNYDSFVYNLVQAILPLGLPCQVYRNDAITVEEVRALRPSHVIISPGPCSPREAGVSVDVIRGLAGAVPILGVCLGHQSLGYAAGGDVVRTAPVHGRTSRIFHEGGGVFRGLPSPFEAARYHSLIVKRETLPACLEVTAWTEDGLIMGLRHREHPTLEGVQFHPESFMTPHGPSLLRNFLGLPREEPAPQGTPR